MHLPATPAHRYPIHPGAWKRLRANIALKEFSQVLGLRGYRKSRLKQSGRGPSGFRLSPWHTRGVSRQLGFVLMEAPSGMRGRFFVAVESWEQERARKVLSEGWISAWELSRED